MFRFLDARLQRLRRIAGLHRDFALRDDLSRVDTLIDIVHGASGDSVAGRQRLRGGVGAAVPGEQ